MNNSVIALDCGHSVDTSKHSISVGYATDASGKTYCYDCCAAQDRDEMQRAGKITLYLSFDDNSRPSDIGRYFHGNHKLTNWPGSLQIPIRCVKRGDHNMAGCRYDFWFTFKGREWHGVQYGDNTQLAHCRRLKVHNSG